MKRGASSGLRGQAFTRNDFRLLVFDDWFSTIGFRPKVFDDLFSTKGVPRFSATLGKCYASRLYEALMTSDTYSFHRIEVRQRIFLWKLRGCPTPGEWRATMDAATLWMTDLESRGMTMGVVVDPSEMTAIDAETRRAAGQWRAAQMPLIANSLTCASYVAPNAFVRGAITAIFWFANPVIPVTVKATQGEGIAWVESELNRHTSVVPPE